ncbi:hypothetical protein EYF80_007745 [Liparis tanakae]|uniref:Uncharacterized protein n=1 Tax=Liparis tanakae TaxID=230148 RepID=A0A4Z2IVS1_9TELE|nr:hypothetical protein EYF80_007745 [Liparis tanakae]
MEPSEWASELQEPQDKAQWKTHRIGAHIKGKHSLFSSMQKSTSNLSMAYCKRSQFFQKRVKKQTPRKVATTWCRLLIIGDANLAAVETHTRMTDAGVAALDLDRLLLLLLELQLGHSRLTRLQSLLRGTEGQRDTVRDTATLSSMLASSCFRLVISCWCSSVRLRASRLWPSPSACWPAACPAGGPPPPPAGFPLLSAEMEALPEEHSSSLGYLDLPTMEVLLLSPFPALSVGSGEEASRVVLRWAMLSALPNLFLMRLANSLGLLKKKGGESDTPGPMVLILSMVGCRPLPVMSFSSSRGDSLGKVLCLTVDGRREGLWWMSLSFIFRWYCSSFFCIWAMF